jgi:hypothetical protein
MIEIPHRINILEALGLIIEEDGNATIADYLSLSLKRIDKNQLVISNVVLGKDRLSRSPFLSERDGINITGQSMAQNPKKDGGLVDASIDVDAK